MNDFFRDLEMFENAEPQAEKPRSMSAEHLSLLADFARELSAVVDVDDLARVVLRRVLSLTGADRALIYLSRGQERCRPLLGLDRDQQRLIGERSRVGQEIVEAVVETGEPVLSNTVMRHETAAGPDDSIALGVGTCICVPLESYRGRIGALYLDSPVGSHELDEEDLIVARLVAVQASQALELLRFETQKREAERVRLENDYLRQLSKKTADEARVIENLNNELKGRTEKLTQTSAFLSSVLESSTEHAIIATDRDGLISTFNAGAVRVYGHSPSEVVGRARLDVLFRGTDRERGVPREIINAAAGPTGRAEGEARRVRKDGREIAVHAATTAIRDSDGHLTGYVDVSRDITREVEMRRQMLMSEKMAALGTLAAGVSHEFNNLLTGIIGFLEHAELAPDAESRARAISIALNGAQRAASLTRQLQSVARPAVTKQVATPLSDLANEAVALVEKSFASEGVELLTEHKPAGMAVLDRSRLFQVLINLLTNARHAVEKSAEKRVVVTTSQEGSWCVLAVRDSGCGMTPEVQRRIFEPFFTTKGALGGDVHDGKIHGTGLGLAISHGIVAEHGGRIEVVSEVGVGSTFRVLLPMAPAGVEANAPSAGSAHRGGHAVKKLDVLVVDDEASIRDLLKAVLGLRGHAVTCAGDGESGLKAALAAKFDVIIADFQMPKLTGGKFFAKLAECAKGPLPRRILITGLPPSELDLPAGLDVVLEKPYSVQDMIRAVEQPGPA